MEIIFRKSFWKDIKNCDNKRIKESVSDIITEIESANNLSQISNLKKLKGYKNAYRIKLKDYRIGVDFENNKLEMVSLLHRKEIYRFFP